MTTVQQIQQEITIFPEWARDEVLDFVLFVKTRISKQSSVETSPSARPELLIQKNPDAWARLEALGQTLSAAWDQTHTAAEAVADIRR